jgi:hypothetical protein
LQYKPSQKKYLTLKNSDIAFSLQVAASAVKVGIWDRFFQASPKPIWHSMTRRKMGRVEEKNKENRSGWHNNDIPGTAKRAIMYYF